jgi:uncharacterized protein YabE (DUF348 family)
MKLFLSYIRPGRQRFLLAGFLFFVIALFAGTMNHASASTDDDAKNGRLVTIYDRGKTQVILTHAQNVADALKDAKVSVIKEDLVEPGLDEPLVSTDYAINIYRARPVIVVDGAIREKIMTAAQTVKTIAQSAGIELRDEDKGTLSLNPYVTYDGASAVLSIDRANEFTLNLYGKTSQVFSHAKTVGEMLTQKNIVLGQNDTISVEKSTPLTEGMSVSIWRNGDQMVTLEEEIPFPIRQIQAVDQPVGYKKIQSAGVSGKKIVTYKITMQNGQEISRLTTQTVVLVQPKEQVEVVGAKPTFSGDFADALARLRSCESGGNYANKRNPLYRGAYQFGYQTWANKYGIYDPADASPAQQDQAARELYMRRGWQPWPACSKKLGLPDIYR